MVDEGRIAFRTAVELSYLLKEEKGALLEQISYADDTLSIGKQIINARSETAVDKPLFRDGMLQRCCLIPVMNYFEWEKQGRYRIRYAIQECDSPCPVYARCVPHREWEACLYHLDAGTS